MLAKELLKKEILFQHDLVELIGDRPFEKPTEYQAFLDATSPTKRTELAEETTIEPVEITKDTTSEDNSTSS